MKAATTYYFSILLILILLQSELSFSQSSSQELQDFLFLPEAVHLADQKLNQTLGELSFNETLHPAHTDSETGKWISYGRNEWTSGYFAGSLWFMFQLTGKAKWQEYARQWTQDMKSTSFRSYDHDVGLRIYGSFGNGFLLTDDPKYLQAIVQGANSLSKRFNSQMGAIKSWDPWESLQADYPVIIDSMMNLEILFLAAQESERTDWQNIAVEHAKTIQKHHIRPDGSSYHIVDFAENGTINRKFTIQGYNENSVWARGQAWAMYGFTMAYRYTQISDFLDTAISASKYFIKNLPDDNVPWYDFLEPAIPSTKKDASAAAIAASALFELYTFTNDTQYFNTAVDILNSLMSDDYSSKNSFGSSILLRSTIHRGNSERGTVYADYYFLEAIKRYKKLIGDQFPELVIQREFDVGQNYPNPFNNQTQFYYSVDQASNIEVNLYDLTGRKIKTLFNGRREPGSYYIQVEASELASGFYIYTVQSNGVSESKKMLLVK